MDTSREIIAYSLIHARLTILATHLKTYLRGTQKPGTNHLCKMRRMESPHGARLVNICLEKLCDVTLPVQREDVSSLSSICNAWDTRPFNILDHLNLAYVDDVDEEEQEEN